MSRIDSVDSVRLLAIIAVITLHTTPFSCDMCYGESYHALSVIINQIARFAVPFFFVVSGYFWGLKIRGGKDILDVTKDTAFRITTIFLAWSFIYLLPYNLSYLYQYGAAGLLKITSLNVKILFRDPGVLLFQGTKVHLWFLVGLLCALLISCLFVNRKREKSLFVFAVILYVAGVLLKSYADSPIGVHVVFNTRNGPFLSTLLFVSGYFLSKKTVTANWFYYGAAIFLMGCCLHFSEIYMLMKLFGTDMKHDYVFGTYLMGMGAAVLSLSNHQLLRTPFLSDLGKMTLGIYAVHYIFVDIFKIVDAATNSPFWQIGYVVIVLACSIVSTYILSKSSTFKRIVL